MKFVLACYGTRGDVEPGAAVGRELLRRGHDVLIAVPPDQVGFAEAAGLAAVAYGPDSSTALARDFAANVFKDFPRGGARVKDLTRLWREYWEFLTQCWVDMSATLTSLADGADMLITGMLFEDGAANVAEYWDIPLATLHFVPQRVNGHLLPYLPAPLGRSAMTAMWWMSWAMFKKLEDAQRRELGLPKATGLAPRRITERGALEIQAYDQLCFPGLAAEWAAWGDQRPFVGALTMELSTDVDYEVASWIAAGTPPICFGFGSMSMETPAETLAMISAACEQLGQRALVCSSWTDFGAIPHLDHVKVVRTMNHGAIFPACCAIVHHGGAGTTNAGLRAGVPTLILWATPERRMWGQRIEKLKVGASRRFSSITKESLVADLRTILAPQYVARAREIGTLMTEASKSVAAAADLIESHTRSWHLG